MKVEIKLTDGRTTLPIGKIEIDKMLEKGEIITVNLKVHGENRDSRKYKVSEVDSKNNIVYIIKAE
jgi:hypothetical protein